MRHPAELPETCYACYAQNRARGGKWWFSCESSCPGRVDQSGARQPVRVMLCHECTDSWNCPVCGRHATHDNFQLDSAYASTTPQATSASHTISGVAGLAHCSDELETVRSKMTSESQRKPASLLEGEHASQPQDTLFNMCAQWRLIQAKASHNHTIQHCVIPTGNITTHIDRSGPKPSDDTK